MPSPARTRLYFDNAATSFPKPPTVAEAMLRYMTDLGASGRGSYSESRQTARLINRCRERICTLINGEDPTHVVFTHNTSDALNLAIKGSLMHAVRLWKKTGRAGRPHAVLTAMEHNSVLRPINALAADGLIDFTIVPVDAATFIVNPEDVRNAIRPGSTVLVCINHASNVTGTIQDIDAIGRICTEARRASRGNAGAAEYPLLMVDAAQSLGHIRVDVRLGTTDRSGGLEAERSGGSGANGGNVGASIDLLAFPGHKGLLGPTGTGGLYIRPGIELLLDTVREGGTGSSSEQETHPTVLPEKYEAGSHNAAGIIGLSESVAWLLERGMGSCTSSQQAAGATGARGAGSREVVRNVGRVREHELELMAAMEKGLGRIGASAGHDGTRSGDAAPLRFLGAGVERDRRIGVYSLIHESLSAHELSALLESGYGILSRAGLACAPLVHRAAAELGVRDGLERSAYAGACRLSLGPFLERGCIERTCAALHELTNAARPVRAAGAPVPR